jgi:hypothetical protein
MSIRLVSAAIRRAWHSSIGRVFCALHVALLLIAIANKGPADPAGAQALEELFASGGGASWTYFAGREFHLNYESLLMIAVTLGNMPALLLTDFGIILPLGWLSERLYPWQPSIYVASYINAAVMLVAGSCQWLLVGSWIQAVLERRGQRYQRILVWAERHQWGLVAGIGGGVVVVIPIVYVRAVLWLVELRAMG